MEFGHLFACLANFLEAVAAGRPCEPGLAQGIYIQNLIDAVRTSGEGRGEVVALPVAATEI